MFLMIYNKASNKGEKMNDTVNLQIWEDTRFKLKKLAKSQRVPMKKYVEIIIDREYKKLEKDNK